MRHLISLILAIGFYSAPASLAAQEKPNAKAAFESGNKAYLDSDFQLAIDFYSQAIALDSTPTIYFLHRGKSHFNLKEYPKAIEDFSIAIAKSPRLAQAYNMRGRAKYLLKDYDGAVKDYDIATDLTQKRSAKSLIGWRLAMKGDAEEALFNWAQQFREGYDNKYDIQAIRDWARQLLKQDSSSQSAHTLAYEVIGMSYFLEEDYPQATAAFEAAERNIQNLAENSPYLETYLPTLEYNLYYVYAGILLYTQEYEQSIQLFKKLSSWEPYQPLPYFTQSQAYFYLNNREKALSHLGQALENGLSWDKLEMLPEYYEGMKKLKGFQELQREYGGN